MSVFIITSGCYSDYCVHGYCTTEENAKKYCALQNSGEAGRWDAYEYEEIECYDDSASKVDELFYQYNFFYVRHEYKNEWTCVSQSDEPLVVAVKNTSAKYKRAKYAGERSGVSVTVCTKTDDKEKAKKISQDILYQWLASKV